MVCNQLCGPELVCYILCHFPSATNATNLDENANKMQTTEYYSLSPILSMLY
jgi:hypothetical protein